MCLCIAYAHFYRLQDMFLVSKLVFAFAELNLRFSVNVLLICILYCDAGAGCLIRTVRKYSILILVTDSISVLVHFSSKTP